MELGRLNVIRSPSRNFDRQLAEVVANWNATLTAVYNQTAEEFAAYVTRTVDPAVIDSPLQNLALLRDMLSDGRMQVPVTPSADLAAILIGTASDKNIPVSANTVIALYTIIGVSVSQAEAAAVAADADAVRLAILAAHN